MVDAIAAFLNSLSGPKRTTSRQSSHSSPPSRRRRADEREEDGFVFLGDTRSERNQRDSNYQADAPPTYDDSQDGLPTFQEAIARRQSGSDFQPASVPVQRTAPYHHQTDNVYRPMSLPTNPNQGSRDLPRSVPDNFVTTAHDIPFELSPQAQILMDSADCDWLIVPPIMRSNPSRFEYDFSHERAVIRETNVTNQTQSSSYHQGRNSMDNFPIGTNSPSGRRNYMNNQQSPAMETDLISFD
ncbi:uncharacterized protein [Ptychodera flava]|uniref:uncharacterized protein n=1 Tax=Ptychodera flava TaxID=63121 RepID=UPI003969D390